VVRGEVVTAYEKTKPPQTFRIEGSPRMIAYMGANYLIACYNISGSSSSVRVYNEDTHSTFCRCGDGDCVKQIMHEWNSVLLILDDNTVLLILVNNEQFETALLIATSRKMRTRD
jgi:hypothetical protein